MFKKFLYEGEPLEFDFRENVKNYKFKLFILIKIFFIKLFRILYKNFQRSLLKPSIRSIIIKVEKLIFFKKNKKDFFASDKVDELKNSGLLKIENLFTNSQLDEITNYLSKDIELEPIYGFDKKFKISNLPSNVKTGYFPTDYLINCPHVLSGANNESLQLILENYFQCKFKLDWIWAWWSFPSNQIIGPQLFHRDYESMNFIKVFVYLSDVGENSGPHEIIKGSHKINKLYKRERFEDEIVFKSFDINKKATIIGNKGATFIANTFALHKGINPKNSKRLVMVYLFSVIPSNRSPKIPVIKFNNLDKKTQKSIRNKELNSLFIDFN